MSSKVVKNDSPLPLDWTRVGSRKRTMAASCCVGGVCRQQHDRRQITITTTVDHRAKQLVRGQVVVCLLESNPDWFQAYLFLESGETWGLLGIQKEVDECLQCSEGGYRVIDLKITSKDETFVNVEWTGGDMMDLKGNDVSMQAEKIVTGSSALPVVEGIFSGLMRKLRSEDEELDVLQVFPDLAVITGSMEVRMPVVADDILDDMSSA